MNQPPPTEKGVPASWLLMAGLLAGALLLGFMAWESSSAKKQRAGSAEVIEFTAANWQREVVESKVPVLVDFGATWCGPCRTLSPTIDSLAAKYKGKIKVGKVDIDDAPEIATKYGVTGIPHVFIFNGSDKPRQSIPGNVVSEAALVRAIEATIAPNTTP